MLSFEPLTESVEMAWSDKPVPWKCNGLIVRGEGGVVLIDCNFTDEEIGQLMERTGESISGYFVTHMHIDHVNNLHLWEARGVPIHCPRPEDDFLRDFRNLLRASGSTAFGMDESMRAFTGKVQGFREISVVRGFDPGEVFRIGNITLKTLPLPGHSPGHTGYIVGAGTEREILFASDLGLDDFGAWYGFDYCDLAAYRQSVAAARDLYAEGDYILAASHSGPFIERQEVSLFDGITGKMETVGEGLMSAVRERGPVALRDLVLTGLYYSPASLEKMNPFIRGLYGFWEYHTLNNHVREFVQRGDIRQLSDGTLEAVTLREPVSA